jgi:membrane fusion protein (multidrug efflux system)
VMRVADFHSRPKYSIALVGLAALLVSLGLWVRSRSSDASKTGTGGVSAAVVQLPLVTVVQPVEKPADLSITLPASVEAFEQATLYAKVSGYVQSVNVDKGDRVKKADVLALLDVPEVFKQYQSVLASVQQAQAEVKRARAETSLKQVTYQRVAGVRQSKPDVLPQQDVDAARAAFEAAQGDADLAKAKVALARAEVGRLEALRQFAKITAPYDGVITARFVDPGALIQQGTNSAGTPLLTIASMDTVRVYIDVPEADVSYVARGKPAMVLLNALPEAGFSGAITRIANAVDPQTRTMKTEIDLPNPGHRILPGMYGTAALKLVTESNALFVPGPAIRRDGDGRPFVYTVEQHRLRKIPVQTGLDDGSMMEVRGLRSSQMVVLSGTASLQEGLAVQSVAAGT